MIHGLNMLGKDEWDAYQFLFIPAIVIFSVVTGLLKRAKRAYDQRQTEQTEREYGQEHRRQRAAEEGQALETMAPDQEEETVTVYRQAPPPALPRRPPPPAMPRPAPARMPRRTPPPPPPVEVEEPAPTLRSPGQVGHDLGTGVQHEVEAQEATRQAGDAARQKRLKEIQTHVSPATTEQGERQARIVVDLGRRSQALAAVVFNEILGPPKALRDHLEPWDR